MRFTKAEFVQMLRSSDEPSETVVYMLEALKQHVEDLRNDDPGDGEDVSVEIDDFDDALDTAIEMHDEIYIKGEN